jgi:hypothetical protein
MNWNCRQFEEHGGETRRLTSLLSWSRCTLKVGSSFLKRFNAREKLGVSIPFALIASEMTGSGTYIEVYEGVRKLSIEWGLDEP